MSMLNNKPLQGYKFGDFVKFKYNTVVYHQEKGLPMFRDVEQYGYIRTTNIMNGKVTVQPVSSDHHAAGMRVEATKVISKASFNGNIEDYPKSAPQGFQVDQPIYDVPKGTPVYAGGDIPIRASSPGSFERVIPYNKSFDKKTKNSPTGLDAEIKKQKEMINGKVNG
tara:strand:- start:4819 stop:5319 length:501 start_codon:yes stop_codon:yes gene_type:complete